MSASTSQGKVDDKPKDETGGSSRGNRTGKNKGGDKGKGKDNKGVGKWKAAKPLLCKVGDMVYFKSWGPTRESQAPYQANPKPLLTHVVFVALNPETGERFDKFADRKERDPDSI